MEADIINYQMLLAEQAKLKGVEWTKISASNIGCGYNLLLNLYESYRGAYVSKRRGKKVFKAERFS